MEETTCQVWWATPGLARSWHEELLTDPERERWMRLKRQEDRDRFLVGNALLRLTVGEGFTIDRTCPDCDKPHGKPRVVGQQLYVSVSHSGDRIAVALTRVADVGVDVEETRRVNMDGLGRLVYSPEESPEEMDFFTTWARKEAILKATGEGLRTSMTTITLPPRGIALHDLDAGPGYAAAVAILTGRAVTIEERDGSGLLDHRRDP